MDNAIVPLIPTAAEHHLKRWIGHDVFLHLEVNRGAYWRNGTACLRAVHVKGGGPYRVFLELDTCGLLQIDDVTHMTLSDEIVVFSAYDEQQRLARTVELSKTAFAM